MINKRLLLSFKFDIYKLLNYTLFSLIILTLLVPPSGPLAKPRELILGDNVLPAQGTRVAGTVGTSQPALKIKSHLDEDK